MELILAELLSTAGSLRNNFVRMAALKGWAALVLVLVCGGCNGGTDETEDTLDAVDVPDGEVSSEIDATNGETADEELSEVEESGEPVEMEGPTFEDLRATVSGEFAIEVSLMFHDSSIVLPETAEATFTVFARDNVTAVEDIIVTVIDVETGEAVADQQLSFRNGLWRSVLTIAPGQKLRARLTDEAGNSTDSEYQLILPTQFEALPGDYQQCFFDEDLGVTDCWDASLLEDGSWTQSKQTSGWTHGGTFELDGDELLLSERRHASADGTDVDEDDNTIEWERRSTFYVDATYLSLLPYRRTSGTDEIVGGWSRSYEVFEEAGTFSYEETLVFDEERFVETIVISDVDQPQDPQVEHTAEGSYVVRYNENYIDNFGDFLVLQFDTVDGMPVTDQSSTELFVIRADQLLRSPYLADR